MATKIEKKFKKNDEIEVEIVRTGLDGEGIAVVDGLVVFVPFAMVGERVLIHIINDKNSFLIAKPIKFLTKSKNRIEPPCKYFSKCGGCDIQHFDKACQDEFKTNLVCDTIKKYAGLDLQVPMIENGEKLFRYRNKFAFPVREENGEIKIGMFKKNSHEVIDIDDCLLQDEKVKKLLAIFRKYMQNNNISAFNEKTNKGTVKHIVLREHENKFILSVVVTDKNFNNFEPLISLLKSEFDEFGVYKNINTLNNNVIMGNIDEHIFGLKELEFDEFGIKYFINNKSFLQVNDEIKLKIYDKILNLLDESNLVIDAYSGAGLLSSIIAKKAKEVVGVEIVKEATQNAEKLKKLNNLNNLTNINGDCAVVIPELAKKFDGQFSIVVDPPRKGLDKQVVDAFIVSQPKTIIYLSCNPATLARDLNLLKNDYEVCFIQPYNMFPQTSQVETLVKLRLVKNDDK